MIRLDQVVKTFAQGATVVPALAGVSLDVPEQQFLAVVGPSGSGKSTLLHLVAGLDTPDSGAVRIGAHDLATMSDDALTVFRRRSIGLVFQFFHLLPGLDAEENVALPLLLDGHSARKTRPRVHAMLERVGLAGRRHHRLDQLSGGEMQRVAIARALVIEPAVLLADEPTGNLDSQTADEILSLLRDTATGLGQTLIMITHDAEAARRADRVVTLRDGAIVSDEACSRTAPPSRLRLAE
jgi:putative ABC transport system ATP-binding protein